MTAQLGLKYINRDGSLTEMGYELFRELEEKTAEIEALKERIAALEEEE